MGTNNPPAASPKGPVLKVTSTYPVRGAKLIVPRGKKKQPEPEKPVGLGREMVEQLLQHELGEADKNWQRKLEEAKQQAYEEGFANGRKETEDKLLGGFQKSNQILRKTAERLHGDLALLMQEQEQQMLRLVLAIARKVVGLEVSLNPDIVLEVLRNGLRLMNEKTVVRIVVHGSDLQHVRGQLDQLRMQFDLPANVEILPSDTLEPGGVRIESEHGSVDADIATQFEEIARRMLKDDSADSD